MGILDEDVARVRESTDIIALIGEQLALKRVGSRYRGLCPFHQEKTASFYVNPELGVYRCFGCQASGDAITFVREMEHLDFVEAVERLAGKAGIQLRYDDKRTTQDRSRKTRLVEAVGAAIDEYQRLLLEAPEAGAARKYLRGRGFDGDAVRRFKLGWAPDEWDHLSRVLQKKQFKREDLVESGLAFVESRQQVAGPVPRPADVSDLRHARRPRWIRRTRARRRRTEVQELAREPAVPQEPSALRAQLGEGGDRRQG